MTLKGCNLFVLICSGQAEDKNIQHSWHSCQTHFLCDREWSGTCRRRPLILSIYQLLNHAVHHHVMLNRKTLVHKCVQKVVITDVSTSNKRSKIKALAHKEQSPQNLFPIKTNSKAKLDIVAPVDFISSLMGPNIMFCSYLFINCCIHLSFSCPCLFPLL